MHQSWEIYSSILFPRSSQNYFIRVSLRDSRESGSVWIQRYV